MSCFIHKAEDFVFLQLIIKQKAVLRTNTAYNWNARPFYYRIRTFYVNLLFRCVNISPKLSTVNSCAEAEGFEPPDPFRSPVFKTGTFDHSVKLPLFS